MKLLSLLIVSLLFTGCAVFDPQQKQVVSQDQQDFYLAFDEFQESHQIDSLQKLKLDYPDSIWAARAETIILYSQELDQCKSQSEQLRQSERQQVLDLKRQKKLNQKLTEQIEQLKSLLIQLEKRPQ